MVAVPVNPEVLVWAREERGLSLETAAARLSVPTNELSDFESGARQPTLSELEKLSQKYSMPLVSLLMPTPPPPVERRRLDDFRAFEGHPAEALSPETILAIEEVSGYIDGLSDLRDSDSSLVPNTLIPDFTLLDNPEEVARLERQRLGINVKIQLEWQSDREAFFRWRELIESQNAFAYQIRLGPDDTRGFAIWDDRQIAALVIDAAEEGYPAKIFTIWHEYAHLLLRLGGISDQNRRNKVEKYCNRFAAFFLMPRDDFLREASKVRQASVPWSDQLVGRLGKKFKVSKSVVAIHLEELGLAPLGLYDELLEGWRFRRPKKAMGRATHIERCANRLGSRYVKTLGNAFHRRIISGLDVYEATNVKPQHFAQLEEEVNERRMAYGWPE